MSSSAASHFHSSSLRGCSRIPRSWLVLHIICAQAALVQILSPAEVRYNLDAHGCAGKSQASIRYYHTVYMVSRGGKLYHVVYQAYRRPTGRVKGPVTPVLIEVDSISPAHPLALLFALSCTMPLQGLAQKFV